jgi:hypothetical protein
VSNAGYDRDGDEMLSSGLYVELGPWNCPFCSSVVSVRRNQSRLPHSGSWNVQVPVQVSQRDMQSIFCELGMSSGKLSDTSMFPNEQFSI